MGAWIEIEMHSSSGNRYPVAPLVGAWIEIKINNEIIKDKEMSLPSWERGLKYNLIKKIVKSCDVAPLVGAWIEMEQMPQRLENGFVAPLVGAWIEIALIYFYFI